MALNAEEISLMANNNIKTEGRWFTTRKQHTFRITRNCYTTLQITFFSKFMHQPPNDHSKSFFFDQSYETRPNHIHLFNEHFPYIKKAG